MTETRFPDTIHAKLHPAAIGKVSRFFDASTKQIVTELFQNARRAKATQIDVTIPTDGLVRIVDNGDGVSDPQGLLSFGRSGWDHETMASEDPAGMGVFSLARRQTRIASRPKGTDGLAGAWEVNLEPEHFVGDVEATVSASDGAPLPHGTLTEFNVREGLYSVREAIQNAATYFPIPVSFMGEVLEREEFLKDALHVETWQGVQIGVIHGRRAGWMRPEINFHGHVIECTQLPIVTTVVESPDDDNLWWVRINVVDSAQLEMVLPARTQVVQNSYLNDLQEAAERSIYRTLRKLDIQPLLDHGTWKRANDLGVKLEAPTPRLVPWRPEQASTWSMGGSSSAPWSALVSENEPLLCNAAMRLGEQQALYHALRRNGLLHRVFAHSAEMRSYSWYRKLSRITDVDFRISNDDGSAVWLNETRNQGQQKPDAKPRNIEARLTIEGPEGNKSYLRLETDFVFYSVTSSVDEIEVSISQNSEIDAWELSDLMVKAFFSPSCENNAESAPTQEMNYRRRCREIALGLIVSNEEARHETITDLVRHYLLHAVNENEEVTVRIKNGMAAVEVRASAEAA